ncbi:MAG: hypothetical protein IJ800_06190 [Clostridia bacterium]|nr:hypothetical protein [Clostridia bacterium]
MCCDSIVLLGLLYLFYAQGAITLTQLLLILALLSTTVITDTTTTTA